MTSVWGSGIYDCSSYSIKSSHMKSTIDIPTTACSTSTFASTLDNITHQIKDASEEYGFSQVLMLVTVRQWADEQLQSHIY